MEMGMGGGWGGDGAVWSESTLFVLTSPKI